MYRKIEMKMEIKYSAEKGRGRRWGEGRKN
jgi:hypothetical protein